MPGLLRSESLSPVNIHEPSSRKHDNNPVQACRQLMSDTGGAPPALL